VKRLLTLLLCTLAISSTLDATDLKLWYEKPAKNWETEALPIGNGRLGAMIFGVLEREQVQFNEESLWIGDESDTGAYQAFGDLFIDFEGKGEAENYRRELNIGDAVQKVTYTKDGVNFCREYIASHPAGVMVFRFTADKARRVQRSGFSGRCPQGHGLGRGRYSVDQGQPRRLCAQSLEGKTSYGMALDYEARAVVKNSGGTLEARDGKLVFRDADSITIFVDAGTNYINKRERNWRGEHPAKAISARLGKATATPWDDLLAAHLKDYLSLFGRVALDLGKTAPEIASLPTNKRLISYRGGELRKSKDSIYDGQADDPTLKGKPDPELEALLFQYARYLMISSSRPGDLPANLQGLWNNSNDPMWRCDYHANVNLQMNYWFVGPANLTECFLPFSEWLHSITPVRREETRRELGVRGWATRWENGIFGGATCPWSMGDAAWLAQNLWDYYAFHR
jgi:alpha-L-fucosidase 2